MGFWGPGLYQNDVSADVKDTVTKYWQEGKSGEEIAGLLLEEFQTLAEEDSAEGAFFWLGLADSLWDLGLLPEEIRARAVAWLDQESVFDSIPDSPLVAPMGKRRRNMLARLRVKLASPQPKARKYRYVERKPRSCGWELYDVYAYQLRCESANALGLTGRWFLFQKIDEVLSGKTIIPIVYVKITKDSRLPENAEEYDAAEYVQVWFTKYEDRFLPLDFSRLQEDIAEKSKLTYEVDEYGLLPQFRINLHIIYIY